MDGVLLRVWQVRHTPSQQRTRDEKRWVAMDVLVNPGLYAHISEIEADEMKFDDDYEVRHRLTPSAATIRQLCLSKP